ncbi:hypothetical protein E2C01_053704 [Portunus trituberculatus]|uniref:Uncharacterized protein n=1 Tax=Portunus trituberculatus TaxID=210409 RepID=A0A5B7GRJ1_PORTR|nr:hypothetical protein [Portunus trituberculatus]
MKSGYTGRRTFACSLYLCVIFVANKPEKRVPLSAFPALSEHLNLTVKFNALNILVAAHETWQKWKVGCLCRQLRSVSDLHPREAMVDMMAMFLNKVQQLATKEEVSAVMGERMERTPRGTSEHVHLGNVHPSKGRSERKDRNGGGKSAVLSRVGGNVGGEYGAETGEYAKFRPLGKGQYGRASLGRNRFSSRLGTMHATSITSHLSRQLSITTLGHHSLLRCP